MATFNGDNIFGLIETMNTDDHPDDQQVNAFNGLNGVEVLTGGSRGFTTVVTGALFGELGTGRDGLTAAINFMRSYRDRNAYVLVDNGDEVWSQVLMQSIKLTGPTRTDTAGTCSKPYTVVFQHLQSP